MVLATGGDCGSPCRDVFRLLRVLPENPDHRLYFCPGMSRTNILARVLGEQRPEP